MKILSLFDGMSCGMIAMQNAGIQVGRYVAYEIDKYAIKTSQHNFPMIEQMGDVFKGDFTQYKGFDFVIAGFPCTTFSVAQKKNRETTPYSGIGWELFEKSWEVVNIVKPNFFLFENNESMAKAVQYEISKIIGFEPHHINSALVSAQNRKRIYWVGKRNVDGTYSKVDVKQPDGREILLKDILDDPIDAKSFMDKPFHVVSDSESGVVAKLDIKATDIVKRVYGVGGKCPTLTTCTGGHRQPKVLVNGKVKKLTVSECKRLQTVPEWYDFNRIEYTQQNFKENIELCKNVKLKDVINLSQAKKLNYVTNTILDICDTAQQNLVENMSIQARNVLLKDAKTNNKQLKVIALSTTKHGNESNQPIILRNVLSVANRLEIMGAMECVVSIMLNGSDTEMLYIPKKENLNLMEILGVNTSRQMTENGFIELLQKKCSEDLSQKEKLCIISTLTNWIIVRAIFSSVITKPTCVCIDSLNDWQNHSLKTELLSLKMGNIGGMSNSSAYKMLGNGWTCDVITHLIKSCLEESLCICF